MAVAVKNTTEVAPSLLDRMAVVSMVGTVYVLGAIGIVFYLLPSLWWMTFPTGSWVAGTFLALMMLTVGAGLAVLGGVLLGGRALPGVRAGIFMGLVFFLLVLLLTRWVSLWMEYWTYDYPLFQSNDPTIGAIATGVAGLVFLFIAVRWFLRPSFEKFVIRLEEQGWFSARPYKPLQGIKVRRGTIFGLLLIAGAGTYTLINHGTLARGAHDWELDIPFTAKVDITSEGDGASILQERVPDHNPSAMRRLDRATFAAVNKAIDPSTHAKISYRLPIPETVLAVVNWATGLQPASATPYLLALLDEGLTTVADPPSVYIADQLVTKEELQRIKKPQDEGGLGISDVTEKPVTPPTGTFVYWKLPLLPSVALTVPLLLVFLSLWMGWRIVNVPAFADFLIATEAELNKVSWTTQRRLVQDTIVVLVTVVLMAIFLFAMDQTWRVVLSWKPIGVLQFPEQQESAEKPENRPW